MAGHETSALSSYARYRNVRSELREKMMILSPQFQYPSEGSNDRGDRFPALDALALLDAVLQETPRLESVLAASQKRVTPDVPSGTSIHGYGNLTGDVSTSSMPMRSIVLQCSLSWKTGCQSNG